jgi:hypothetical protein
MSWATLNGTPIFRAMLVVPYTGIWHADVSVDRDADVTGPQVLQIGNSAWNCTLVRAVDWAGVRRARLVGGAGGWRKSVPGQQYASPVGVPTVTVLSDVALAAGEIPPVVDASLGPTTGMAFVRQAGLASLVLDQVCGDQWWMDPTGTVQTSVRLPSPIGSPFSVEHVDGACGKYVIQTENPEDWAPGATFTNSVTSGTISRTMWTVDAVTVRVEVLAA